MDVVSGNRADAMFPVPGANVVGTVASASATGHSVEVLTLIIYACSRVRRSNVYAIGLVAASLMMAQ